MSDPLPDCMMPDGGDACVAYANAVETVKRLRLALGSLGDELDTILAKYELPRTRPIGWTDTDYERIADYVEPMRREVERLREIARTKSRTDPTTRRPTMNSERFARYAARLIFVDFAVAMAGAFMGVQAYFWYATIQCGH